MTVYYVCWLVGNRRNALILLWCTCYVWPDGSEPVGQCLMMEVTAWIDRMLRVPIVLLVRDKWSICDPERRELHMSTYVRMLDEYIRTYACNYQNICKWLVANASSFAKTFPKVNFHDETLMLVIISLRGYLWLAPTCVGLLCQWSTVEPL